MQTDRRTKAVMNRDKAARLMAEWKIPVTQARYSEDGHWYALLTRFPSALVDSNGYLLFESEEEFKSSPHLAINKQISVRQPGISAIPGYVRMVTLRKSPTVDIDVHEYEGTEGITRLLIHLTRERDQSIVRKKKSAMPSLACEICSFSFANTYGAAGKNYCEVHHLIPLSESRGERKTLLKDLSVLCSNCHRVVHLKNPPYTIEEVKRMFRAQQDNV